MKMKQLIKLSIFVFIFLFFLILSLPINAQCYSHSDVIDQLGSKYGDTPKADGIDIANQLIELFVSPNREWVIIIIDMEGCTFIGGNGHSWEFIPPINSPSKERTRVEQLN